MGLGRGWACIGINDQALATRIGQVRPRGAGSGRVGPVRAEWGWGGVE